MSDLPARPALAEVLRALCGDLHETMERALAGELPWVQSRPRAYFECRRDEVALLQALSKSDRRKTGSDTGIYSSRRWITLDPREALELLQTRGIAPEDDVRRSFLWRECSGEESGPVCTCGGVDRPREMLQSLPDLIAWASLGISTILRAEELARHGAHLLTLRPSRIVWRVAPSTPLPKEIMMWQWERQRTVARERGHRAPCDDLFAMGIQWVSGDDHTVTLCVAPVGAT